MSHIAKFSNLVALHEHYLVANNVRTMGFEPISLADHFFYKKVSSYTIHKQVKFVKLFLKVPSQPLARIRMVLALASP